MEKQSQDANLVQSYGIKFETLLGSNYLESKNISVVPWAGSRLDTSKTPHLRFEYSLATHSKIGEINTFYWALKGQKTFQKSIGNSYIDRSLILFVTDAPQSGWSSNLMTIFLGKDSSNKSMSYDASLILYFFMEANVHLASQGAPYAIEMNNLPNVYCGSAKGEICCRNDGGCARAISSGLSDFFVALHFPDYPGIGESISGDLVGISTCDIVRNPTAEIDNDKIISNSCKQDDAHSNIYALGAKLSRLLFATYQRTQDTPLESEFKQLVLESPKYLNEKDNFESFINKLKSQDLEKTGGKISTIIEEFQSLL